jgi:hypothetical protein
MYAIFYHTEHHIPVPVAQWVACHHGYIILQTPANTELSWNGLHWECTNFQKSRNHINILRVSKGTSGYLGPCTCAALFTPCFSGNVSYVKNAHFLKECMHALRTLYCLWLSPYSYH